MTKTDKTPPANIENMKASFEKLKKTATSIDDVVKWFKKNPTIVPGFPAQYANKVDVYESCEDTRYDTKAKTILDIYTFTFEVISIDEKPARAIFRDVTGINIDNNASQNSYFNASYDLAFDAREWRFTAVIALRDIDSTDFDDKDILAIYSNILKTHFPHMSWETYAGLWSSGLLPDDTEDILKFLTTQQVQPDLAVPQDFAM